MILLTLLACLPPYPYAMGEVRTDASEDCAMIISEEGGMVRFTDDATAIEFIFMENNRPQDDEAFELNITSSIGSDSRTVQSDDQGWIELSLDGMPELDPEYAWWSVEILQDGDYKAFFQLWPVGLDEPAIMCAGHADADGFPAAEQSLWAPITLRAWTRNAEGLDVYFSVQEADAGLFGTDYQHMGSEIVPVEDGAAETTLDLSLANDPGEVGGIEVFAWAWLWDGEDTVGDTYYLPLWVE